MTTDHRPPTDQAPAFPASGHAHARRSPLDVEPLDVIAYGRSLYRLESYIGTGIGRRGVFDSWHAVRIDDGHACALDLYQDSRY